jgi:hypothetical protein
MSTDSPFYRFLFYLGNVETGDCYQKKLCNLAFIVANKCIAINWKVGYPPTMHGRNVMLNQIKCYLSHAPNTVKCLLTRPTNNALRGFKGKKVLSKIEMSK